jgi:hypothetical protein
MLLISTAEVLLAGEMKLPLYFDLGPQLVQEFRGTYEFKYKRVEFVQTDPSTYLIRSSGDQSPREDKLILDGAYVYWILGRSGERWVMLRNPLHRGDQWRHTLRGWNQRYRVVDTDLTVSVPAGEFNHCAKVTISWVAHEHDMEGPQKFVLYLAPHLGIIKREYWSSGAKEHEEVLTSYTTGAGK